MYDGARMQVRWTAPEAMALNKYSIKSDIWSFGIMIAEVVTYGLKPYHGQWHTTYNIASLVSQLDLVYAPYRVYGLNI